MNPQNHATALNWGLVIAIVCAIFASCLLGSVPIPASDLIASIFGGGETGTHLILWEIRVPRAVAAVMVGAALGASGAALQGLLRNPLAEPGVLGVSASASLCATIAIFWGLTALSPWVLPAAAIAGAVASTLVLASLAPRVGSVVTLILIGVGISSLAGAIMMLLLNLAPNPFSLADMINWTMGSVANRSFGDLAFAAPFWTVGLVALLVTSRDLLALGLGEEGAQAIGVDSARVSMLTVVGAGLMTGAAVSIAGAVGFVGIVAPHLVRPLVGHDPGRAVVPSALLGGLLLMIADAVARIIPTQQELKLGVIIALIGAPIFIAIAATRKDQGDMT
jgi:iron complex transport system permease protein